MAAAGDQDGDLTSPPDNTGDCEWQSEADIVFLVEGQRIYAVKTVLKMWSPVFKAMFESDFKEKAATEIPLPGKKADAFRDFMSILHPPNKLITDLTADSAYGVLELAREYQVQHVIKKYEQHLSKKPLRLETLDLACQMELTELKDECIQKIWHIIEKLSHQCPTENCTVQGASIKKKALVQYIEMNVKTKDSAVLLFKTVAERCLEAVYSFAVKFPKPSQDKIQTSDDIPGSSSDIDVKMCTDQSSKRHINSCKLYSGYSMTKLHILGSCKCSECENCKKFRMFANLLKPLKQLGIDIDCFM